jgi:hypothetical protein
MPNLYILLMCLPPATTLSIGKLRKMITSGRAQSLRLQSHRSEEIKKWQQNRESALDPQSYNNPAPDSISSNEH